MTGDQTKKYNGTLGTIDRWIGEVWLHIRGSQIKSLPANLTAGFDEAPKMSDLLRGALYFIENSLGLHWTGKLYSRWNQLCFTQPVPWALAKARCYSLISFVINAKGELSVTQMIYSSTRPVIPASYPNANSRSHMFQYADELLIFGLFQS